jgi:hypothetical protein
VAAHGAGAAGVGDDDDTSLFVSASKSADGAENPKAGRHPQVILKY